MLSLVLAASLGASSVHLIDPLALESVPRIRPVQLGIAQDGSREALLKEYQRVESQRPSVALPVASICFGGTALVLGALTELVALLVNALEWEIVGAIGILGGAGFVLVGVVLFLNMREERRTVDAQLEVLQRRLDGDPGEPNVMPPAQLPAQTWRGPVPGVTVARF